MGLKLIDYEFAMVRLDHSHNIFKVASDYPAKKFMVRHARSFLPEIGLLS